MALARIVADEDQIDRIGELPFITPLELDPVEVAGTGRVRSIEPFGDDPFLPPLDGGIEKLHHRIRIVGLDRMRNLDDRVLFDELDQLLSPLGISELGIVLSVEIEKVKDEEFQRVALHHVVDPMFPLSLNGALEGKEISGRLIEGERLSLQNHLLPW